MYLPGVCVCDGVGVRGRGGEADRWTADVEARDLLSDGSHSWLWMPRRDADVSTMTQRQLYSPTPHKFVKTFDSPQHGS